MRVKLAARGGGRWQSSGGYRSKFGLTVAEILQGLNELKTRGMEDCLQLLHFHLGSQIPNIRIVKGALNEAARVYVELVQAGAGLKYMDVGGGLGVDYDGSQTNFESSVNYTLQEYANDVVYHLQTVCDEAKVAAPDDHFRKRARDRRASQPARVQRAGRHRASARTRCPRRRRRRWSGRWWTSSRPTPASTCAMRSRAITTPSRRSTWRSTCSRPATCRSIQRSQAESLYWAICMKLQKLVKTMEEVPEDLQHLDESLSDTYFCNFSLFQSVPDSWAIKQLFPIMPIHRLNEQPTRHAVLGDITCDSDGKVDQFIDRRDVRRTLPLHAFNGSPYYLGIFLVGAYQEILGDLHNLYGDTHAVHVSLDADNRVVLDAVIKGDTVREVLSYVQFDGDALISKLRMDVETAVRDGRIDYEESGRLVQFFEDGLHGYTYLEERKT